MWTLVPFFHRSPCVAQSCSCFAAVMLCVRLWGDGGRKEGRRCGFVLLGTDGRTQGNRTELCMGGQEEVRKRLSYGEGVRQQSCAMPCTGR